jgi:hypothetical protein
MVNWLSQDAETTVVASGKDGGRRSINGYTIQQQSCPHTAVYARTYRNGFIILTKDDPVSNIRHASRSSMPSIIINVIQPSVSFYNTSAGTHSKARIQLLNILLISLCMDTNCPHCMK